MYIHRDIYIYISLFLYPSIYLSIHRILFYPCQNLRARETGLAGGLKWLVRGGGGGEIKVKFLQGNQDMHTWMDPRGGHTDLVEVALVFLFVCFFAFNDPILENLKDSLASIDFFNRSSSSTFDTKHTRRFVELTGSPPPLSFLDSKDWGKSLSTHSPSPLPVS